MYTKYNAFNAEHNCRQNMTFMAPEGYLGIRGIFSVILPQVRDANKSANRLRWYLLVYFRAQNTKVSETQEFRKAYSMAASQKISLTTVNVPIVSYRGDSIYSQKWMDEEKCEIFYYIPIIKQTQFVAALYSTLCRVKADTTEICKSLKPQVGAATYYEIDFEVVLALGLTELKAYMSWVENVSNGTNYLNFTWFYHHW